MSCANCGSQTADNAPFCAFCGASIGQEARRAAPQPAPLALHGSLAQPRRRGARVLTLIASLLLILLGSGFVGLAVAGTTASARVTGYEQKYMRDSGSASPPDSRRYQVDYEFAAGGERYTGSVTRIFQGGSHTRPTMRVRYLPFWPHVNAEDAIDLNPAGPVMLGIGVLLLIREVRKQS